MIIINTLEEYQDLRNNSSALLCYFSTPQCNVCKVLKPKVADMISDKFPEMKAAWIDIERSPVIAGQNNIFIAPTLLIYFEGKESIRKSRNVSIFELEDEIRRSYNMIFKR